MSIYDSGEKADNTAGPTGTVNADDMNTISRLVQDTRTRLTAAEAEIAGLTPPPSLTNFRMTGIPSRIDTSQSYADTNQGYSFTAFMTNRETVDFTRLIVAKNTGSPSEVTIGPSEPIPSDGANTPTANISGAEWTDIIAGNPTVLTFRLEAVKSSTVIATSNTYRVERRDLPAQEPFYHGLRASDDSATVATSALTSIEYTIGDTLTVPVGPATAGQYLVFLVNDNTDITITNDHGLPVLGAFTKTEDARVINSENFDTYVLGPLNANYQQTYTILTKTAA